MVLHLRFPEVSGAPSGQHNPSQVTTRKDQPQKKATKQGSTQPRAPLTWELRPPSPQRGAGGAVEVASIGVRGLKKARGHIGLFLESLTSNFGPDPALNEDKRCFHADLGESRSLPSTEGTRPRPLPLKHAPCRF